MLKSLWVHQSRTLEISDGFPRQQGQTEQRHLSAPSHCSNCWQGHYEGKDSTEIMYDNYRLIFV